MRVRRSSVVPEAGTSGTTLRLETLQPVHRRWQVPESGRDEVSDDLASEHDTLPEVDACFRSQRRIAVGYFVVFIACTLAVPGLTLVLNWWSQARIVGGMSPNFAMAAFGIYVFLFVLSLAAGLLANAVEDGMLGGRDVVRDDTEPPV